MINENMISGVENIPNVRNGLKPSDSTQRGFARTKTNALGDLGNTLHSRLNSKAQSSIKPLLDKKESDTLKPVFNEAIKSSSLKLKSSVKNQTNPLMNEDADDLDFHDHFLCEQADYEVTKKHLLSYMLTEKQIKNTVNAFQRFNFPAIINFPKLYFQDCEPIPHMPKPETNDSFSEFMPVNELHKIPPPTEFMM